VIAILGGLSAAALWATANLASSRSTRLIGAASTVAWMLLVGLIVAAPFAAASGPLPTITPTLAVWLAASGFGSVIGLLLIYRGMRIGKVGVVLALASTEGAIAAVFAVVAGESLSLPTSLVLGAVAVGIAIVAFASGDAAATSETDAGSGSSGMLSADVPHPASVAGTLRAALSAEQRAVLYGAAAAIAFGFSIYGTARVGIALPIMLAVLPARVVGVTFVFVPLALTGRLRMTRRAAPLVAIVGLGEVLGNVAFVVGARESIAIASVLASQYAAFAAVAAFFLFRERLSPKQRSGFVIIAVGVAVLTGVRG
jgi:drug/metabolite transporter (DMT)-like permease